MKCCFCKASEALELNPDFPLCGPCVEVRDFMMEWADTKDDHGLSAEEYAMDMIKFYSPASPVASASVN